MILKPRPVSTAQLTYNPQTFTFIGEISSTNGFGRVYDDAADEGLTLVSAATGREVTYLVNGVHRDPEGDIVSWDLVSAEPDVTTTTIVLFND